MVPVAQLLFQDDRFEVAQGGRHVLKTLSETYKLVFDCLLAEAGVQQPWFKKLDIPSVERDFANAMLIKHTFQMMRDVLITNRSSGRRLQESLCRPAVIGDPIALRFVMEAIAR